MNLKEYFEIFTGGNDFVETWTPKAIMEFAEDYNKIKSKWISVKDELPGDEVLAVGYQNIMLIGWVSFHEHDGYYCDSSDTMLTDVTHWMPLPSPPKD